jgi:hypothetical protein
MRISSKNLGTHLKNAKSIYIEFCIKLDFNGKGGREGKEEGILTLPFIPCLSAQSGLALP